VVDELPVLEEADDGLGVPGVDSEQHGMNVLGLDSYARPEMGRTAALEDRAGLAGKLTGARAP
jgi:hypothetical protein